MPEEKTRKNRGFLIFFKIFSIVLIVAVVCFVGYLSYRFISDPEQFSAWIKSHGMWGYAVYVGITILQIIVTVIPGVPRNGPVRPWSIYRQPYILRPRQKIRPGLR